MPEGFGADLVTLKDLLDLADGPQTVRARTAVLEAIGTFMTSLEHSVTASRGGPGAAA